MEEETQEKRHRSQNFSGEEIKELVNLVSKFKHTVSNKSIVATASRAKDDVWAVITRMFNSKGYQCVRSSDSLRMKWENLKKESRRHLKNGIIVKEGSDLNLVHTQIAAIMCQVENENGHDSPDLQAELLNLEAAEANNSMFWNESGDNQGENEGTRDDILFDENNDKKRVRSTNFSPQDCVLLLRCVKQETQHVFNSSLSSKALQLKNKAWSRITQSYNKLSPNKRDTKTLRNKFRNIKSLARQVGFKGYYKGAAGKHNRFDNESTPKKIKREPCFDSRTDEDSDCEDGTMFGNDNENDNDKFRDHNTNSNDNYPNRGEDAQYSDPLSPVFNDVLDSRTGSSNTELNQQSENPEIVKLKMELLNYQMETAKMERKRLEDLVREDAQSRERRDIEEALRLRAARLEALAAAGKLPPQHPALAFTLDEARGEAYLNRFQ